MKPHCIIITCSRSSDELTLATSTLTFDTIRKGFPNAQITVIDNNSCPEAFGVIRKKAEKCGVSLLSRLELKRKTHAEVIERTFKDYPNERLVLLDPDLIFWSSCEDWEFSQTLAGRFIPAHYNEYTKCMEVSRLHTSFLWINSVKQLYKDLEKTFKGTNSQYSVVDLITPRVGFYANKPMFWDTLAGAYQAIGGEPFTEKHLEFFDHLICGTGLDIVKSIGTLADKGKFLEDTHRLVLTGNLTQLKGLWRQQAAIFESTRI